jgi:hypothetical protein
MVEAVRVADSVGNMYVSLSRRAHVRSGPRLPKDNIVDQSWWNPSASRRDDSSTT